MFGKVEESHPCTSEKGILQVMWLLAVGLVYQNITGALNDAVVIRTKQIRARSEVGPQFWAVLRRVSDW